MLPNTWHRYYFESHDNFLLPSHSKTIEYLEGIFIGEQNKAVEEQNKENNKTRGKTKGDFIPRKIGERWTDDQGRQWQTIF